LWISSAYCSCGLKGRRIYVASASPDDKVPLVLAGTPVRSGVLKATTYHGGRTKSADKKFDFGVSGRPHGGNASSPVDRAPRVPGMRCEPCSPEATYGPLPTALAGTRDPPHPSRATTRPTRVAPSEVTRRARRRVNTGYPPSTGGSASISSMRPAEQNNYLSICHEIT
jgi:hypothetical protein